MDDVLSAEETHAVGDARDASIDSMPAHESHHHSEQHQSNSQQQQHHIHVSHHYYHLTHTQQQLEQQAHMQLPPYAKSSFFTTGRLTNAQQSVPASQPSTNTNNVTRTATTETQQLNELRQQQPSRVVPQPPLHQSSSPAPVQSPQQQQTMAAQQRECIDLSISNSPSVASPLIDTAVATSATADLPIVKSGSYWSDAEKAAFAVAFEEFGPDWHAIAAAIPSRSHNSVRTYYQRQLHKGIEEPAAAKPWTDAEKAAFAVAFEQFGRNWQAIATAIPSRTYGSIKSYGEKRFHKDRARRTSSSNDAPAPPPRMQHDEAPVSYVRSRRPTRQATDTSAAVAAALLSPPNASRAVASHAAAVATTTTAMHDVIEIDTDESSVETPPPLAAPSTRRAIAVPLPKKRKRTVVPQTKRSNSRIRDASRSPSIASSITSTASSAAATRTATRTATATTMRGRKRLQAAFAGITTPPPASLNDGRACEFCRSVASVGALLSCTACCRAYHAKCLAHHFQPHCQPPPTTTDAQSIASQLEALRVNAPSGVKVALFRCAPCFATLVECLETNGYAWDCDCASCQAPEKLVDYRRRLLLQFMGNSSAAAGDNNTQKAIAKPKVKATAAVVARAPVRSGARRRGRSDAHVREQAAAQAQAAAADTMEDVVDVVVASSSAAVAMDAASKTTLASPVRNTLDNNNNNNDNSDNKPTLSPVASAAASASASNSQPPAVGGATSSTAADACEDDDSSHDRAQLLSPQAIVAAVAVKTNAHGVVSFPIVCTETPSLNASGLLKEGTFVVAATILTRDDSRLHTQLRHKQKQHDSAANGVVRCSCCAKEFTCDTFVRHTDATFLLQDDDDDNDDDDDAMIDTTKHTTKRADAFLFAVHRCGTQHTPLQTFLALLETHRPSSNTNNNHNNDTIPKKLRSLPFVSHVSPSALASTTTTTATTMRADVYAALTLVQSVTLTRRVGGTTNSSGRTSSSSSSNHHHKPPLFRIKVACLEAQLRRVLPDNKTIENLMDAHTPRGSLYKDGWLSVVASSNHSSNHNNSSSSSNNNSPTAAATATSLTYTTVQCSCCDKPLALDAFIDHSQIRTQEKHWDPKFKRRFVFVPQHANARVLVAFDHVWHALLTLQQHAQLERVVQHIPTQ